MSPLSRNPTPHFIINYTSLKPFRMFTITYAIPFLLNVNFLEDTAVRFFLKLHYDLLSQVRITSWNQVLDSLNVILSPILVFHNPRNPISFYLLRIINLTQWIEHCINSPSVMSSLGTVLHIISYKHNTRLELLPASRRYSVLYLLHLNTYQHTNWHTSEYNYNANYYPRYKLHQDISFYPSLPFSIIYFMALVLYRTA